MAKKDGPAFFCKQCGHECARWEGKCPACGEWDALVEAPREEPTRRKGSGGKGGGGGREPNPLSTFRTAPKPLKDFARERIPRLPVPIGELHRVLGGGAVPGGSVLVGGEPGIGKSTLLLQTMAALAAQSSGPGSHRPCLYISGEEAPSQIAERGLRLGAKETLGKNGPKYAFDAANLLLASETDLDGILALFEELKPRAAVVDSVQTLRGDGIASAPGSVAQVRECTMALVDAARKHSIALFLIGHVTKEGVLAGPRVLEHVVDTVLHFEGESQLGLRALRALKNRYGSTHEVGLFEMTSAGLAEVPDPSAVLADLHADGDPKGPGSMIGAVSEGSRVLLVEFQALTVPAPGGGSPRRRSSGLDANRVAMLLAVLEAKAGIGCGYLDVFASTAGGFRVDEPAADLPLALALASAASGRPLKSGWAAAGEVGLGGELRGIPYPEARLAEAQRLGFAGILLPARGRVNLPNHAKNIQVIRSKSIADALQFMLA